MATSRAETVTAATRRDKARARDKGNHDSVARARDRDSALLDRVGSTATSNVRAIVRGQRPASAVDVPAKVAATDQDRAAAPNADGRVIGSGLPPEPNARVQSLKPKA